MAKRKKIYSSPFEAEWAVLNHKAFLPHLRVTTEGKAMGWGGITTKRFDEISTFA